MRRLAGSREAWPQPEKAEVGIMGVRTFLATGGGLLLAAALGVVAAGQDSSRLCPDSAMTFDLVSNFEIVVRGQIGKLTGLKFILDTGSSSSMIDRRVADRLGLRRRPGNVFRFDRDFATERADIPELRLGPMRVMGVRMNVARLADLSLLAEHADGIIGMDVLSRARKICVDYEGKRIFFELDGERARERSTAEAFVVPLSIQGVSLHFLVDTGLEYLVVYKDRLRSALPNLHIEGEPRDGVMGRLRVKEVNIPGIGISGAKTAMPILLIEGPRIANLAGVDGYLGPAALHAKRLELDFVAQTIRWQ